MTGYEPSVVDMGPHLDDRTQVIDRNEAIALPLSLQSTHLDICRLCPIAFPIASTFQLQSHLLTLL